MWARQFHLLYGRGGPLNHALGKDLLSMTSYGKVESLVGGCSLRRYCGVNWATPHFVLGTPLKRLNW